MLVLMNNVRCVTNALERGVVNVGTGSLTALLTSGCYYRLDYFFGGGREAAPPPEQWYRPRSVKAGVQGLLTVAGSHQLASEAVPASTHIVRGRQRLILLFNSTATTCSDDLSDHICVLWVLYEECTKVVLSC